MRDIYEEADELVEKLGGFGSGEELPMYSYERPLNLMWRGFITGLLRKGFSSEEAAEVLQSKFTRHFLDGNGEEIGNTIAYLLKGYSKQDIEEYIL